jgi:ubiquinone/menaquinone biosynthesis C-methylase UbiE
MTDSKHRFSNRVDNYARHRPSYPPEVVEMLALECGLDGSARVADVGSGTGILTELLLARAGRVYAVEPNAPMREAAERRLGSHAGFVSVDGSAEATTLEDASVNLVTVGQAFHWYDQPAAKREFARVLVPGGWVALVWNVRDVDATPFMAEYEDLLRAHGTDYEQVNHRGVGEEQLDAFFGAGRWRLATFAIAQSFDLAGLQGRLLSASYVPAEGQPGYAPMLDALRDLFARHAEDGRVSFEYATRVFYGQL